MTSGPQTGDRAEGLLDQIAAQALDDDYYLVRAEPPTRIDRLATGVALAVFALLVTVAAVQTQVDRPATEREQQALADDVEMRRAAQERRQAAVADLRDEVADLAASADRSDPAQRALLARTAGSSVRGPGVVVTVTPVASDGGQGDVRDDDLQRLVNTLWFLGAEAISINDERIGTTSSVRTAGDAITVNYRSIDAPYVVRAIGDAEQIEDRLEDSRIGRDWRTRSSSTGLGFSVTTSSDLTLPRIDAARLEVPHATPVKEAQ